MMVKVMTWNIWSGKNWSDVGEVIKESKADIIGLQEVDRNQERTRHQDIPQKLANALGYNFFYSPSIDNGSDAHYGNCILSRFPIKDSQSYFLSSDDEWSGDPETEPRTLLETEIEVHGKSLYFFTTHLGYSKKFQNTKIKTQ